MYPTPCYGNQTLCDCCMCCFIDECIFKFKEQGFPQALKTWEGSSKFDGVGGGGGEGGSFSKNIGELGGHNMTFLKSR